MAKCSGCGRGVGCSCNLIGGLCTKCYANTGYGQAVTTSTRINATSSEPNSEFNDILNTTGISREEKLRRINEILERARLEQYDNNTENTES